jgi:hypothetical protein
MPTVRRVSHPSLDLRPRIVAQEEEEDQEEGDDGGYEQDTPDPKHAQPPLEPESPYWWGADADEEEEE